MMPTRFSWLWYLVGLAGMALMIFGLISLLGSAAGAGLLVPLIVVGAVAIWYVVRRFRRSLDEAVANAPSRQGQPPDAAATDDAEPATGTTDAATGETAPTPPSPVAKKPPSGPPRTSRR
jgi:hypothetical protein